MKTKTTFIAILATVIMVTGTSLSFGQGQGQGNGAVTVSIAPNPVKNILIVHFNGGNMGVVELRIVDQAGQMVLPATTVTISHPGHAHLSIDKVAPGLYNLIYLSNGCNGNVPFIKQ